MLSTQPIDPHSLELLRSVAANAAAIPAAELTIARRRALSRASEPLFTPATGPVAAQRENLELALPGRTLRARLYRPEGGTHGAAGDLLLVYFHGGGWVAGDLDTHDNGCAFLANALGGTLLSVEYRKAPEHPYPLPCDDARDAYRAVAARLAEWGCARIAVGGDSAGAHVAVHAMHAAPDVPTAGALLFYPVTDMRFDNPSYQAHQTGPGLTAAAMLWFWQQFLGHANPVDDDRAVPMRQRWQRPPPPTVISVARHDPLHDEGAAYGELLRAAGAPVRILRAGNMAHGFLRQCAVNAAAAGHVRALTDALLAVLDDPTHRAPHHP